MTAGQISLIVIGLLLLALVVVLLTDGRFFGKRITFWVYDRLGPTMFGAGSDADRWQRLAKQLDLQGNERILDVGTAVGDLPLTLASQPGFTGAAIGVDWSPRMMSAANAAAQQRQLHHHVQFQVVDLRNGLPFANQEFDIVVCLGLLETWPHPEKMLAELVRVLGKNGRIVLSLYHGWSSKSVALSLDWHQKQLTTLGLTKIKTVPCSHNHNIVIAQF